MTIVVTGGGSGGHITPILAVASELKKQNPKVRIVYIGQTGDALGDVPAKHPSIDEAFTVRAGKFRRSHGEGWKQLLDLKTMYLNARDALYVIVGICQSWRLLGRIKPDVIFTRGGFVSVPVGLAGAARHIPYITHDSDAIPSLANRIIARWAHLHAVALPEEVYPYPIDRTKMVGIPIGADYKPSTPALMQRYRKDLGLEAAEQVIFVTGGGNGARELNLAVVDNAAYLLKRYPKLAILHTTGRALERPTIDAYDEVLSPGERKRVVVQGFVSDFYRYSGAADIVIARGGATNLAEFAVQGKACIIVPSPQLVWNIRNTEVLAGREAVIMLTQEQAEQERRLAANIESLLDDDKRRAALAERLSGYARPHAARDLAELILEMAAPAKTSQS